MILKTKLQVKIRDAHKIERNNSTRISVFDYENNEKISNLCVQCCEKKTFDLLLIGEGEKEHYALINDFNRFKYDHLLHLGKKNSVLIVYTLLQKKY